MSNEPGPVSSSSMISLQRSMHSSQMYTPGPAINFFTWRCDFPQKLQRSCSFESVGRAKSLSSPESLLVLRDYSVDEPVFLRLFGAHEVVALGISGHLFQVLAAVVGQDLVKAVAHVDDLLGVDLDVGGLSLEGRGDLVDEDLRVRQRHALARRAAGQK